jgi:acetylornithine deacetylase/succinyl-diaminopimelate desuccinylase-like protein
MLIDRRGFLNRGATAAAGSYLGVLGTRGEDQQDPRRPHWKLTTSEEYDPETVAAYAGDHSAVYRHIVGHLSDHLMNLQTWLRQRSISAQNDGVAEMAELVRQTFLGLGCGEARLVPTDGHPGVWGYYDVGAKKTLMVYLMYDVQPVNPEDWRVSPFDAEVVDHPLGRVLMARGATNQKGPERAFLNALESIIAVDGKLPVNLMFTAEGEEELGSPNYEQVVAPFEERLRAADGVLFPFNSQNPQGNVGLNLGVKGILYMEIEASGGRLRKGPGTAEIHGSYKAVVDSPVWHLLQGLSTLVSPDGNTITVDGYYDPVELPSEADQRLINRLVRYWDDDVIKQALDVPAWIDDWNRTDAILHYLYDPTLNIDGIWGGYTGQGVKTILPHMATAKVDSRLPPGCDSDSALQMIREHLRERGFGDLEVRQLSGYPPSKTPVDDPLIQTGISVYRKYGQTPIVWPHLAGSAPFHVFTERLGLPLLMYGMGHGSGTHSVDEYMVVEPRPDSSIVGLAELEKAYVDLVYALA